MKCHGKSLKFYPNTINRSVDNWVNVKFEFYVGGWWFHSGFKC